MKVMVNGFPRVFKNKTQPNVTVHISNPNTGETEAGGSSAPHQSGLEPMANKQIK